MTCILAVHHFSDIDKAFQEAWRVLDNGKFVILTATHRQMQQFWLSENFSTLIQKSIEQMPDFGRIEKALLQAGFIIEAAEPHEIQPDLQDFFLCSGKHRPYIYLDP